jgi:hypothetical protein
MPAETRRHRRIADGAEKACSCAAVGGPADYIFMHVPNKGSGPAIKRLLLLSGSVVKPKPSDGSRLTSKREDEHIRGRPLLVQSGALVFHDIGSAKPGGSFDNVRYRTLSQLSQLACQNDNFREF